MPTTRVSADERRTIVNDAALSLMFDHFDCRAVKMTSPLAVDAEKLAEADIWERTYAYSRAFRTTVDDACRKVLGVDRNNNVSTKKTLELYETTLELAHGKVRRWSTESHTRSLLVKTLEERGGRFVLMTRPGVRETHRWEGASAKHRLNFDTHWMPSTHRRFSTPDDAADACRKDASTQVHGSGSMDDHAVWDGLEQKIVFHMRRTDKFAGNPVVVQDWTHAVVNVKPHE